MKIQNILLLLIVLIFFNTSSAASSDSTYHFAIKKKYFLDLKSTIINRFPIDSIPDEKVIDSVLLQKAITDQIKNDTTRKPQSEDDLLKDEDFNEKTKLSDKNLIRSIAAFASAIFALLLSRFLGPLQFLGAIGSIGVFLISIFFAVHSFKYSRIKIINFFISFLGVVVSLIALGIFIISIFSLI
jgi:hypothetical protein